MAKHIALLSCICILVSCTMRNPENGYAQLIQGDWLSPRTSEGFEHDQMEYFIFEDSTCRMPYSNNDYYYDIQDDTLYIRSMKSMRELPIIFPIVKLTKDSLVLLSGRRYQNTIRYTKTQIKNNITPGAIYFASSGCKDGCSLTYVQIDSNRNFRYYYEGSPSTLEVHKGKLSETEYNRIINKIRCLPVDSLKEYYSCSLPDEETLSVAIAHDNKITRSRAFGHEAEPIELYILLNHLMFLNQQLILQPDSSMTEEDFIAKPEGKLMTSLLEPQVFMKKFTPPKLED
jgi:uncharacterized protein DUF6438